MARTHSAKSFAFVCQGWAVFVVCTMMAVAALCQQAGTPTRRKPAVEARQGRSAGPFLRIGGAPTIGPKSAPTGSRISQVVASTSKLQTVTLTNMGDSDLNIANLMITGADAGDFAITGSGTTCSTSNPVPAGGNCTINLMFTPTGGGTRSASLIIADNAPGTPHSVPLSGTGMDFTLSAAPASASVSAGQSASFAVAIAPAGGFAGSVSLQCSGTPALSTCLVSPTTVAVGGTNAASATVTVTTTGSAGGEGVPAPFSGLPVSGLPAGMLLLALIAAAWYAFKLWDRGRLALLDYSGLQRPRNSIPLRLGFAALAVWLACVVGACGSASAPKTTAQRTPAGTSELKITAQAAVGSVTLSHSATVTLTIN